MIVATAFNIAVTALCFVVLFLIYLGLLRNYLPAESFVLVVFVLFIGSLVLAFFIYRKAIKAFLKKHPLDEHSRE